MPPLPRIKPLLPDPLAAALFLLFLSGAKADEPTTTIKESFAPGQQFHIQSRFRGTATLTLPPEKDKQPTESLSKTAESVIDYDERVLENDGEGLPNRLLRVYSRIDFHNEIGKAKLDNTIREEVRRLVLMRDKGVKAPFSPDGPLLNSEIELVRIDVFTPLLAGILPSSPVKPGDSWKASETAVHELTDTQVESGSLDCKLDRIQTLSGRKVALIRFDGSVKGVNEDGPVSHELMGWLYFDLESNHICYLSLKGKRLLHDKDGKTTGSFEGTLTITRQAHATAPRLADTVAGELKLTPDGDNTLLLYDNEDLGLRFLYPRRWRIANVDAQSRQVTIDAENGNGVLLTLLPSKDVPTEAQYSQEIQKFIAEQKGQVFGTQKPRRVQSNPEVDYFGFEAEMKGQRLELDYYVARQHIGGVTVAARLIPENIKDLRPEVERIARSIVVTK
jgi:hypothetical protein